MSKLINFYNELPKNLKSKKLFDKETQMNIPYRLSICGPSSSGKTNTLLNLIRLQSGIFYKICLCTKQTDEPLYQYLISKAGDQIEIINSLEELGPPEQYALPGKENVLIIFDDMCLEKPKLQDKIIEFWIRGRKLGISCVYLSQSYIKIPITIRRNNNFLIIKKLSNLKDIKIILSDYNLGNITKEQLINIYKYATSSFLDFLLIDIDNDNNKFRKNFNEIIKL
jgi:hypothetical protein